MEQKKTIFSRITSAVIAAMTAFSTMCNTTAFAESSPVNNVYDDVTVSAEKTTDNTPDYTESYEGEMPEIIGDMAVPTAVMLSSGNTMAMANDIVPLLASVGDEPTIDNAGSVYQLTATDIADYDAAANSALRAVTIKYVPSKMFNPNKIDDTDIDITRKDDDFTVAISLSVNTVREIATGGLEVRLPRKLFDTRNGEAVYITSDGIGVDAFPTTPVWNDTTGKYKIIDYVYSDAFINYFYDESTDEYVFVNYQTLSYANQPTIDLICYGDSVYPDNKIHILM